MGSEVRGSTFLIDQVGIGTHLWVVLSDPDSDDKVVVVPLSTRRKLSECACVLDVGDHPFLTHETDVKYESSRLVTVDFLARYCKQHESCSEAVIERVLVGASKSDRMPLGVQQHLRDQGMIG
jgi:hypothetical protein